MEQAPPPGWYPDPSRRGGRRLWDGTHWTGQVREVPGHRPRRRGRLAPMIAAGIGLIVVAVSMLAYGLSPGANTAAPAPTTAEDRAAPPAELPVPQPSADPVACAVGDPSYRGSEPGDGRLHGGGLAMPKPAGWTFADPSRLSWAFDVGLAEAPGDAGWAALGAVRIEEPYSTPEQASATITACLQQLADPETLRVTRSASTAVPGAERAHQHSGTLRAEGKTREFRVVVADLHSPESLAIAVRLADPASPEYDAVIAAEDALTGA